MAQDAGAIPYFSKEWVDAVVAATNEDGRMAKIGKNLNERHAYIVVECPDGTDRVAYFQFENGRIVDHGFESHPTPIENFNEVEALQGADFITTSTYDFMTKVNKKEVNAMKALMSSDIQVQGDKAKMMRQIKPLQHWQDLFKEIPVTY